MFGRASSAPLRSDMFTLDEAATEPTVALIANYLR